MADIVSMFQLFPKLGNKVFNYHNCAACRTHGNKNGIAIGKLSRISWRLDGSFVAGLRFELTQGSYEFPEFFHQFCASAQLNIFDRFFLALNSGLVPANLLQTPEASVPRLHFDNRPWTQ